MGYSPRSQGSFLREFALREEISGIENQLRYARRKVAELEMSKQRLSEGVLKGETRLQGTLSLTLREIEDEQRKVKMFEEQISARRTEVEKLKESAAANQEKRTETQKRIAELAVMRLRCDRVIDEELEKLRQLLEERAELTYKMQQAAAEIELKTEWDDEPYSQLLSSLPDSLLLASENWSAKFLGKPAGAKPYAVRVDPLVLPETLAHSGVYFFGETVQLSEEDARELLREDIPAPRTNANHGVAPAKIMPLEDFQEAVKAAKQAGVTIREILLSHDLKRNEMAKKRFQARPWSIQSVPKDEYSNVTASVKVEAKRTIHKDGREYKAGETFIVESMSEFWQLADIGAIALRA